MHVRGFQALLGASRGPGPPGASRILRGLQGPPGGASMPCSGFGHAPGGGQAEACLQGGVKGPCELGTWDLGNCYCSTGVG